MESRLRELRKLQGLTKAELAAKAGVSERTIWAIEHGTQCRMDTKRRLLKALTIHWSRRDYVFPRPGDEATQS